MDDARGNSSLISSYAKVRPTFSVTPRIIKACTRNRRINDLMWDTLRWTNFGKPYFFYYLRKQFKANDTEGRFTKLENVFSPNHRRILFCGLICDSYLLRISGREPEIRPFFIDFANETPPAIRGLRRGATNKEKIFCESYGKTFVPAYVPWKTKKEVERERFIFRKFLHVRGEIPFRSNRNNEPRESAGFVWFFPSSCFRRGIDHLSNVCSTLISCFCTDRKIRRIHST